MTFGVFVRTRSEANGSGRAVRRRGRVSAAGWRTSMTSRLSSMQALGAGRGAWLLLLNQVLTKSNLGAAQGHPGEQWRKMSPAASFMRNGTWEAGGKLFPPNRDQSRRMAGFARPAFSCSPRRGGRRGRQPSAAAGARCPSAGAGGSVAGKKRSGANGSRRSHIRQRAVRILRWVLSRAWRTSWVRSRLAR
jgi:hypothetical protein